MIRLKIALQKSGRLHEESIKLIKYCGINIESNFGKKLKIKALNFPMEIFFLRDDDIPQYIQDGVADIGIVGKNVVLEKQKNILIEEKLDFGFCKLSIAVPKGTLYKSVKDLHGKRIATSYPNILKLFLEKNNICSYIHNISGSVEIAPNIGVADAICDIVSSGITLFFNNLKEIETILYSEAVLVCCPHLQEEQKILAKRLVYRIQGVKNARKNKFLLFNVPFNFNVQNLKNFLPRMNLLPLSNSQWIAVQAVVPENIIWNTIEKLKKYGAQDFMVKDCII